jgi:hypothetical protein
LGVDVFTQFSLKEKGCLTGGPSLLGEYLSVCAKQLKPLPILLWLALGTPDWLWTLPAALPSTCLSRPAAGSHRLALLDELPFFLKRGNPKEGVQEAKTCRGGEQSYHAQASHHQAGYTALQPTQQEQACWQEHNPDYQAHEAVQNSYIAFEHDLFSFQ